MLKMDLRLGCCLTVLACFYTIRTAFSASGTDAKNLTKTLFVTNEYNTKVRPSNNQTDPIEVNVNFYLLSINALDEVSETLKTTGYLWISWKDEFLQWDPNDYGGLDNYFWPQGDVWKPDVALKNSYLEYKELGVSSLNVNVDRNGDVTWSPFQVFQSTCSLDIKYFPFDVQECKLIFVAWSYTKDEVNISSGDKGIVMDEFETNSEWDVIDTSYSVDQESGEAAVVFKVKMKRKPLYHLLSMLMPIIMLAVLNIFVFMLPSECGEKASYAITVFLAFAVFLSIIAASFPANSDVVAVFSVYVIVLTLQSTLITLLALVSIRCSAFNDDETPVPRILQSLLSVVTCRSCKKLLRKNRVVGEEEGSHDLRTPVNAKTTYTNGTLTVAKEASTVTVTTAAYTWTEALSIVDRILFVFFTLVLVIATMVFFIMTK